MSFEPGPRVRQFNRAKRIVDLAIVIVTAPIVAVVAIATAVVVKIKLGSPVLFRQPRIGYLGREFGVLKFRTMSDARDSQGQLLPDASRLNRTGRVIRALSLDEIPQVLNVARGDMALVGPRPLFTRYLAHYRENEHRRHWVRPGITGYAQVMGRNTVGWDQRLQFDAEYVNRASLWLDFKILVLTVKQVLSREGVSVIAGDSGEPLDIVRAYPSAHGYTIRRFERADIPSRVAWMNDRSTREHMRLPQVVTIDSTHDWVNSIRQDASRRDFTVVDVATTEPVAMLGLKLSPVEPLPELYIFVRPSHRGRGIGRIALQLLFEWMARTGTFAGCMLYVDEANGAALRLYSQFGFELDHRRDGRVRMQLSLADWKVGHEV